MFSEVRSATRGLIWWRGGAVIAVATLAIGIGAMTGLYALVQAILPGLPGVPEVDRLGRIYASSQALGVERSPVALTEYDASLSKSRSFAAIGAYAEADATLGIGSSVRAAVAGYGSPGFFAAMGVLPAAGRAFEASDIDAAHPVAILSDALWRRQFSGGRFDNETIVVDGVERTIIGVMPPQFDYSLLDVNSDVWLPLGRASTRTPAIVNVYARLRDGVGWPAAAAELRAMSQGQWTWHAIPLASDTRTRALRAYAFALGPALIVLLIACVNVACMLMTRGLARDRELSVRRALGATRLRIARLLLMEHLLLALAAGTLGCGLAVATLRGVAHALAAVQPGIATRIVADARLLPVALGASALACLLFGMAPALRLSRRDVASSLNGVPPAHRIEIAGYGGRDAIVFAEIASAVGLIVWTAMIFTLFAQLRAIVFSFPANRVVAMRVDASDAEAVASRVAAVPGVMRAAISTGMLGGARVRVDAEGTGAAVMSRLPVGADFLQTLGVPLIRGRSFDAAEQREMAGVVILSESAARELAPGRDPLGLRLRFSGRGPILVVIGVCRDAIDYGALAKAGAFAPAEIYVPYEPGGSESVVLARLSSDPHAALRAIAAAAQTPAGTRPVRPVILSEDINSRRADGSAAVTPVLGTFAILTLMLAASGVFAVVSQSVAQRTREFGIRLAVGASPAHVMRMVLARETKLIGAAIACGVIFALALTHALFTELTTLNAIVPARGISALLLSAGVAALAVALATRRIVRLEPSAVLRRH
jgi:putative ABC transport system permease protein